MKYLKDKLEGESENTYSIRKLAHNSSLFLILIDFLSQGPHFFPCISILNMSIPPFRLPTPLGFNYLNSKGNRLVSPFISTYTLDSIQEFDCCFLCLLLMLHLPHFFSPLCQNKISVLQNMILLWIYSVIFLKRILRPCGTLQLYSPLH